MNNQIELRAEEVTEDRITLVWEPYKSDRKVQYKVFWSDRYSEQMKDRKIGETQENSFIFRRSTCVPHYFRIEVWDKNGKLAESRCIKTEVRKTWNVQREKLNRGLAAICVKDGVFLSWRMLFEEVRGYSATGLSGTEYQIYRNGKKLAFVSDSTNYLDKEGTETDVYSVAAVSDGEEGECCKEVTPWKNPQNYMEIYLKKPEAGVTPEGESYDYEANDMSIGDADGDGELEFYVKWAPLNSQDNSIRGYSGKTYIDCYKLDGTLLWRLDLGINIRSGAHYTQFIVMDFNGDQKAEMSVKTAPGTCMTTYYPDGTEKSRTYITMPDEDKARGFCHGDNYVCSPSDYYEHIVRLFLEWREQEEVKNGQWPSTIEECFHIPVRFSYPLERGDAETLADYFMDVFAPSRSDRNKLREFRGFIYEGPEYLTMFAGDGTELETIPFPHPRDDDGLRWGDYALPRIEPCNRVDRFLSGAAFLDGEHPYLIVCRGYYTRTTIVAYDFRRNRHDVVFDIDSGYVPMNNPFWCDETDGTGSDRVYGILSGQGNHSLSVADVDGDGCQEIIYGAAVIDHDGSILYSSYGYLPDGTYAKFGHGDAMHTAVIDPDRPGFQIFHVFENGSRAPYGWALCDAETGDVIFGERSDRDLGRCMIGDVTPDVRGLSVWTTEMYDCRGNRLPDPILGTNQNIHWAADLSTQIIDGADHLHQKQIGKIMDNSHGVMLDPIGTSCNNSTKGNPCLVADVFGDFREELILRTEDSRSIRIYMNTEVTKHKMFTLLHDSMYRAGVAWQNNCYNQPGYTSFYYASDMDFSQVLPYLEYRENREEGKSERIAE